MVGDRQMSMEHQWNDTDGKAKVLRLKPVPVLICPPQIPHGPPGIKPGPLK
jgi:hypothetical protein